MRKENQLKSQQQELEQKLLEVTTHIAPNSFRFFIFI